MLAKVILFKGNAFGDHANHALPVGHVIRWLQLLVLLLYLLLLLLLISIGSLLVPADCLPYSFDAFLGSEYLLFAS